MPPTTRANSKQQPNKPVKIKLPKVLNAIAQETAKPAKKVYPTRKVIANRPSEIWSVDLAVMTDNKEDNNNMAFMLNCVDVFSRFAWSVPIPNKSMEVVLDGLKQIVKDNQNVYPDKLWTDKGSEFYNKKVKEWCKDNNITLYSTYGKAKSAMVERFNRTIKTKIWAYFIGYNTHNWVDILSEMIFQYNDAKHSAINTTPRKAHNLNDVGIKKLYKYQYGDVPTENPKPQQFHVGNYVRLSRIKGIFEKGYHASWTEEIFKIVNALNTVPWTYQVEDLDGETIEGSMYEPEMQITKQKP